MTIADENSIYVGGLPSDSTEETLREAFHYYGSVVAVKIINDREVGGKSYGFVTFTNPKSADNAIYEMNGRTIGGRVVRVNEARARGGRPNFHRENFSRDSERDVEWDRGRDRNRNFDHDRGRYYDRNNDWSQEREREREYEHSRDHDQTRDRCLDRDRDEDWEDNEEQCNQNHGRDWARDRDRRSKERDKAQLSRIRNCSHFNDRQSREQSSNSSDDYHDEVKEQLEISNQRLEELQREISQIEEKSKEKEQLVSDLWKKSLKLEDALATTKKLSSHRQMQLTKLQRCFLQVKDCSEKLKASEQELHDRLELNGVNVNSYVSPFIMDGLHGYMKARDVFQAKIAIVDTTMIEASMDNDAS